MSYHILHYRLKKLKRAFLIWITLISLLINLWIDNIRFTIFQNKNNEKSRVQIKRARWFTNQLIKLGSAFIKIGQLLSARPDLIPNTWIQELSKLQDQVPNFSFKEVEETIREELETTFKDADLIKIPWIMFGSNEQDENPKQVLTDTIWRWNHDKKHPHPKEAMKIWKHRC